MSDKAKYTISDLAAAIRSVGASPARIAEQMGCTRGTVYAYLRKYPELRALYERARGDVLDERAQYPREVFAEAIRQSHGVKAAVAAAVGCSRSTVDNALDKWPELREMLDAQRALLLNKATSALVTDIDTPASEGHQRAYMFVLRTLGKDEGFTERTEVTGADGAGLLDLSPETVKLIESMGLDMSEVARQFEAMVKAAAVQKGAGK
jgi:AcrR family transcriptional regulator